MIKHISLFFAIFSQGNLYFTTTYIHILWYRFPKVCIDCPNASSENLSPLSDGQKVSLEKKNT